MYTASQKKTRQQTVAHNHQTLTNFQTFFTGRLGSKFATNLCLNIPTHLKYVATLPREIMSEKWRQSKTCIVINDKSQGSKPSILDLTDF